MPHWIKDILIALGVIAATLGVATLAFFWATRGVCTGSPTARVDGDFVALTSAMKTYKLNAGHYPSTEQGFQALITKPQGDPEPRRWSQLLDRIPLDAWGHRYLYTKATRSESHSFTLRSIGPDGTPFTDDDLVESVH